MTGIFGALRLPASVVFGSGQRKAIGLMTAQIGKHALVCTDARMGQDADFKAIVADIAANGSRCASMTAPRPTCPWPASPPASRNTPATSPTWFWASAAAPAMDMAKCVAVLLQHGGSLRDYYGENKIPRPGRATDRCAHHLKVPARR